ncbi:hypothetical protein HAX54_047901, partial [Datura stramonium]|nr:hypothetical protein [Datura stramonium]
EEEAFEEYLELRETALRHNVKLGADREEKMSHRSKKANTVPPIPKQEIDMTMVFLKSMVVHNDIVEMGLRKLTSTMESANLNMIKEFYAN